MSKEELPKINNDFNESDIKKDPVEKLGDIIFDKMHKKENKKDVSDLKKKSSQFWHDQFDIYDLGQRKAEEARDERMVVHYEKSKDSANRHIAESLRNESRIKEAEEFEEEIINSKKEQAAKEVKNNKEKITEAGANEKQKKKAEDAGVNFIKGVETASEEFNKESELLLPIMAGGNGTEESLNKENKKEEKLQQGEKFWIEIEKNKVQINSIASLSNSSRSFFDDIYAATKANDHRKKITASEHWRQTYSLLDKRIDEIMTLIEQWPYAQELKKTIVSDNKIIKNYEQQEAMEREAGWSGSVGTPEEKQSFYDAEGRKKSFIENLRNHGIDKSVTEEIYDQLRYRTESEEESNTNKENESNKKGDLKTAAEIAIGKSEEIIKEKQENQEGSNKKTEKEEKLEEVKETLYYQSYDKVMVKNIDGKIEEDARVVEFNEESGMFVIQISSGGLTGEINGKKVIMGANIKHREISSEEIYNLNKTFFEKNKNRVENYGGIYEFNERLKDYKRLQDLENAGANIRMIGTTEGLKENRLFKEWDELRLKIVGNNILAIDTINENFFTAKSEKTDYLGQNYYLYQSKYANELRVLMDLGENLNINVNDDSARLEFKLAVAIKNRNLFAFRDNEEKIKFWDKKIAEFQTGLNLKSGRNDNFSSLEINKFDKVEFLEPKSEQQEAGKAPKEWSFEEINPDEINEHDLKDLRLNIKVERAKKEKYGIEDPSVKKTLFNIAKGGLNTVGSVFGVRSIWETYKLIRGYSKKKDQRKDLSDLTVSLLEASQEQKIDLKKDKNLNKTEKEGAETEKGPIVLRIQELNAKLKEVKMPPEDKKAMRIELAQILKEYRHAYKDIEEAKIEKTGPLLDLYINNSAQKMVVAREMINTISIATFMPWLRTVGYTAFAGLERATKAGQTYDKKHFREAKGWEKKFGKIGEIAKNLTIDSARETFNGLTFNVFNKEKKGGIQKSAEFAGSIFMLMRVAGLAEFEHQLQTGNISMQEGAKKFWENLENGKLGGALEQGGVNMLDNAKRVLSYVGLAENPNEAMKKVVETKADAPKSKTLFEIIQEEEKGKKQEELGKQILEKAKSEYQEKLGKEIAETAKKEFIAKIATIGKGEGIEHGLIRQLENNPQGFGYKGNPDNFTEMHRWAQNRAHIIAAKNDFYDSATGEESRVIFDAKHPSQFILNKDESVEVINRNTYGWKPHEETKTVLENVKTVEERMGENHQALEEFQELQKIRDYKLQHDLFGKSDEEIKNLMRLEEMEKTMTMTEGNEKGMENPPEFREQTASQSIEQPKIIEQVSEQPQPIISEERIATYKTEHNLWGKTDEEIRQIVFDEQSAVTPKTTKVAAEQLFREQLLSENEKPSVSENLSPERTEKGMEMPPEMKETPVIETAPAGSKNSEEIIKETPVEKSSLKEAISKEEIGYREKMVMLKNAGISDEDISKLSVKDIENMTKEQIEKIRIEEVEAPSDINLTDGFSYQGGEGNFKVHFNYDAKGDVVGYALDAKTNFGGNLKLQDSVLKENWQETFNKNRGFFRLNSLDRTRVQNQATEIGEIKKILDSIKEKGLSGKKEYEFLARLMNNRISNLEHQHGDIFK